MQEFRYMAYPFLKEESRRCDFEIATDELASMLGLAMHAVRHIPELKDMVRDVYHLNGSIRGSLGVNEDDLTFWNERYVFYQNAIGMMQQFVLPVGCEGACHLHVARSKVKAVLRIAYAIDQGEKKVPGLVLDLLNLFSNLLFLMALYENRGEGVEEVLFVSKSYGN